MVFLIFVQSHFTLLTPPPLLSLTNEWYLTQLKRLASCWGPSNYFLSAFSFNFVYNLYYTCYPGSFTRVSGGILYILEENRGKLFQLCHGVLIAFFHTL